MTEAQLWSRQSVPWAAGLVLGAEPERVPARAAFSEKLDHVRAMHARAVTRLRRATTIERKWARRVRMLRV